MSIVRLIQILFYGFLPILQDLNYFIGLVYKCVCIGEHVCINNNIIIIFV